jgi:hypothetical protein
MSVVLSFMYRASRIVWVAILLIASSAIAASAQDKSLQISFKVNKHFRFVAYGDTRFTDPANVQDTNPVVRQELIKAIAAVRPAFISFGGDIPFNGFSEDDWRVYDRETSIWRDRKIPVFPALGNHELRGDLNVALANYFARFPMLQQHRYYSVRAANTLLLSLDSSLDETAGAQGEWLSDQFRDMPANVDFVFVSLHHPPVTSAGDKTNGRGGSSARPAEQQLAAFLEQQQMNMRARIVVFASHVHNYERHERGGVTYFVTGGGGAHAYPISRASDDPFQSADINYHYLLVEVHRGRLKVTMNRIEIRDGVSRWTRPDSVVISCPKRLNNESFSENLERSAALNRMKQGADALHHLAD